MLFDPLNTLRSGHVVVGVAGDPEVAGTIRRFCATLPCRVFIVDTPREALELVASTGISLVVADERLGSMTGSRLLREVARKSPSTARLLLASRPGAFDEPQADEERPHGVIAKSADPASLRRTVLAILRWQEERSRNQLKADV
jgi:DNA-binding NarL/FixJ family response regulator